MRERSEPLIGIDLGTTNSVVAYIDPHGRPLSVPNADGDVLTPSVVYFEANGPAIVGREAIKAGKLDADNMIEAVKRDMGRDFCQRTVKGKWVPPAAVSGVILHRLREDTSARTGPFERAVVTVPAYFNEPRRKATIDAAQMAGLQEVELLNEPTAAALAFGYELGIFSESGSTARTRTPGRCNLLVYDLGGGTFDVTLMRIEDRHFRALVCDGDVHLGGLDWDARIVQHALDSFLQRFGIDLREHPESLIEVRFAGEELKRSLSQRLQGVLRMQFEDKRMAVELTRDDLGHLTADLLGRTRMTCELAMMEASMSWSELDALLLVGGSSRMPMVRDMLRELSGLEPSRAVSPDEAVAHGAALYAQMLWGSAAGRRIEDQVPQPAVQATITDINSHSLGIVGRDKRAQRRVSILIPKNTPIPHSNSKVFRLREQGQRKVYIQIVEGESVDPNECAVLGECRLVDLPAGLPEDWPVTVTFAYRRDGRVFVQAEVKGAEPVQLEITRKDGTSRPDFEAWAAELLLGDDDSRPNLDRPTPAPPESSSAPDRIASTAPARRPAVPPPPPPDESDAGDQSDEEDEDVFFDD